MNAALREIADRRRRAAAIVRMRQMVAEGEIDFSVIEEPDGEGVKAEGAKTGTSDPERHSA